MNSWSLPLPPRDHAGDTAIAVHPDDERYTHLHGKSYFALVGKEILVSATRCGPNSARAW
ncbi:MAG: hypothetical protein ACLRZH_09985 [Ruthenibacterium lactatiformans]